MLPLIRPGDIATAFAFLVVIPSAGTNLLSPVLCVCLL